ncbi:hypothetical protein [Pseudomonas sp.]|uniref:hypothetical protein n=1 Tax=Pseudomonas sp. TaxID=306 RepID=UPI00258C8223|nr:hypothetical protein [Pseudomonas sp.]
MSSTAASGSMREKNPWLEDGQISREKVRAYIQAEQANMANRLALGEDMHLVICSQQARLESYLGGWSEDDRIQFHTIYAQEFTSILNESTLATKAQTQKIIDEQNSMKAGGYAVVAVFAVILFFFLVIKR